MRVISTQALAAAAPIEFKIWSKGANVTDHGTHLFTDRSASELMAQQEKRGNIFSIDVDHLSLNPIAPPESRKAVGWHELEVRDGDLWATNVRWTDAVKGGLEKDPPEWRYFSPAYDVDQKTGEICGYLNTALTNNPATHNVTALATRAGSEEGTTAMTYEDAIAAMQGDDEEKKTAALAAIKAAFGEESDGDEKKDPPKDEKKETVAASADDEKKDPPKEEEKKDTVAATRTADPVLTAVVVELAAVKAELAATRAKEEDKERESILASHDISPAMAKTLVGKPLSLVKEIATAAGLRKTKDHASIASVTATRGETLGTTGKETGDERSTKLPKEEAEEMRKRFGRVQRTASIHWQGNKRVMPILSQAEAREHAERLQKASK